jgi:hypothetical protein
MGKAKTKTYTLSWGRITLKVRMLAYGERSVTKAVGGKRYKVILSGAFAAEGS